MIAEFHPSAEAEFAAAITWYESRVPGLGNLFRDEAIRVIWVLCARPLMGKPFGTGLRRLHLRRFPYALIYRVNADNLRIIAVAHTRRRPGYWSRRR